MWIPIVLGLLAVVVLTAKSVPNANPSHPLGGAMPGAASGALNPGGTVRIVVVVPSGFSNVDLDAMLKAQNLTPSGTTTDPYYPPTPAGTAYDTTITNNTGSPKSMAVGQALGNINGQSVAVSGILGAIA